jgi:serine/threonine-protein kinase
MEALIGRQLGPYQILRALGKGGMATVFLAYQPSVARNVALKVLHPSLAQNPEFHVRFQREARVLANLQHPHILAVYDFGVAEDYAFVVMPYLETGTLANRLTGEPLPLAEATRVVAQVADALDYAASRGVVHRDVKPSNVLLDGRGNCLLSDFGIAKLLDTGPTRLLDTASGPTLSGNIVGTPAYLSPEQGRGDPVDLQSDLYSLGVVLYEMVTGRVPFEAETPVGVIFKHLQAPLPLPTLFNPSLPAAVEDLLLRALAKDRRERFATGAALAQALQAASTKRAPSATQTLPVPSKESTLLEPAPAPHVPAATPVPLPAPPAAQAPPAEPALTAPRRGGLRPALLAALLGALCLLAVIAAVPVLGLTWLLGQAASPTPARTEPATHAPAATTLPAPTPAAITPAAATPAPSTPTPSVTLSPSPTPEPTEPIATRPPFQAISLSPIANASLAEDYAELPRGAQVFAGVPFDLSGTAFKSQAGPAPNSGYPQTARLPLEIAGVRRVSVLLTSGNGFRQWEGEEIGRITAEFAEGEPLTFALVLGENIREWHAGGNVVDEAPRATEVWQGPIAGHPELAGWLDLLTFELPPEACDDVLTGIEFQDTSQITLGSADPALNIAGLSVALCPAP